VDDFDGDGLLDVVTSSIGLSDPMRFFHNLGNGRFEERTREVGLEGLTGGLNLVHADYDNDGRPDLFLSVQDGRSLLFHNDGPKPSTATEKARWGFTEVAEAAGVTGQRSTFPCWSFDYDNDGFEDLFVAGYRIRNVGEVVADLLGMASPAERSRLYRNRGDGTFEDVSKVVGLDRVLHAMGSNFGDLDNDGWLDFYLGTGDPNFDTLIPNRMFRNDSGRRFQDVTTRGGFGTLQKGHAVAFADFDNDGDQDVYEDLGGAYHGDQYPNVLLENPGHGNHWIQLRLEGRQANRSGIGTRIRVRCRGPEGERVIHRTGNTGGSFGANPLRLEIGLGKATEVSAIEIDWPGSRTRQTVEIPKVDTAYLVREGEPAAQAMELRRFGFARTPATMDHSHLLLRPPPPSSKSSSPPSALAVKAGRPRVQALSGTHLGGATPNQASGSARPGTRARLLGAAVGREGRRAASESDPGLCQ